jgi:hypothetical protein
MLVMEPTELLASDRRIEAVGAAKGPELVFCPFEG